MAEATAISLELKPAVQRVSAFRRSQPRPWGWGWGGAGLPSRLRWVSVPEVITVASGSCFSGEAGPSRALPPGAGSEVSLTGTSWRHCPPDTRASVTRRNWGEEEVGGDENYDHNRPPQEPSRTKWEATSGTQTIDCLYLSCWAYWFHAFQYFLGEM